MEGAKQVGTAAKKLLDRTSDWMLSVQSLVMGGARPKSRIRRHAGSAYHEVHAALVKFIATAEAVPDAADRTARK